MTDNDKPMLAFYDKVVAILSKKSYNHPKNDMCTAGICSWCKTETSYNVSGLLPLVAWFLKHGPDISPGWVLTARRDGFNPEELHDVMLGIFIGGDQG